MKLMCTTCSGTGIGEGMRARFGELMNRCIRCDGHGVISNEPGQREFVAIFPVSERYVVHITVPMRRGGFVPIQVSWSPRLPGKRGRSALTLSEQAAYARGRNAALAAHMDALGGGDFSVVQPKDAH